MGPRAQVDGSISEPVFGQKEGSEGTCTGGHADPVERTGGRSLLVTSIKYGHRLRVSSAESSAGDERRRKDNQLSLNVSQLAKGRGVVQTQPQANSKPWASLDGKSARNDIPSTEPLRCQNVACSASNRSSTNKHTH